jgi:RNA polymerase sigma factor (TIGR02999 family)
MLPLLYEELRALARRQLRFERGERTIRPTALVHEAYLKLVAGQPPEARDRAHFLAIIARAMRQVLVDHARRRRSARRGGGLVLTTLVEDNHPIDLRLDELIALDEALQRLEPRQRQIVECRFFAGLEESEIAEMLGITERTVRRDWVKARAHIYHALYAGGDAPTAVDDLP